MKFNRAITQNLAQARRALFAFACWALATNMCLVDAAQAATPGSDIPAALVGTWRAASEVLTINADGTFSDANGFTARGTCLALQKAIITGSGTVAVSGTTLTLNTTSGKNMTWSCGNRSNAPSTTKPATPHSRSSTWEVSGTSLILDDGKVRITYSR